MKSRRRRETTAEAAGTLHRYHSPLRYPGGKSKLAPFIARLFEANGLCDGEYAEPYAGGSGVALFLLFGDYASRIHINDLDRSIYAFWHCVLNETDWLSRKINDTRLSIAEWRRQHEIQHCKADAPLRELGFSTFFLNRTNRSGIIGSGGVIGGLKQKGEWGIDARFNRVDLIRRIKRIAGMKSRINLTNQDALVFLAGAKRDLPKKSLVYLDPPYFVKGKQKLYANYYRDEDHKDVSTALTGARWPWVVSYDSVPAIRRLYRDYRNREYDIRYTAAGSYVGCEMIFFSPGLVVPRGLRPLSTDETRSARAS